MAAPKKTKPVEVAGELEPMLTRLKLTAIRDQLDTLLDQTGRAELNLREALAMLCTAEVARKDERRIQMGMSIAKFPYVRTLEGFEYDVQPSVDPKQIRELATSRWVANGDSVLLLGPPGVGKTHLAVAMGREAIVRGYSTLFVPATGLVTQLARAHAEGRLEERCCTSPSRSCWLSMSWATCRSRPTLRTCSSSSSAAATSAARCW
jgi:DNA replication protein DnaC